MRLQRTRPCCTPHHTASSRAAQAHPPALQLLLSPLLSSAEAAAQQMQQALHRAAVVTCRRACEWRSGASVHASIVRVQCCACCSTSVRVLKRSRAKSVTPCTHAGSVQSDTEPSHTNAIIRQLQHDTKRFERRVRPCCQSVECCRHCVLVHWRPANGIDPHEVLARGWSSAARPAVMLAYHAEAGLSSDHRG